MSKTRAIRFPKEEERQIEEFLEQNPFFDFSTLARMAILDFIKNPKITIKAVQSKDLTSSRKRPNGPPQQL